MSSLSLTATSALDNAAFQNDGLQLQELPEVRLLSMAAGTTQMESASRTLESCCQVQWPTIGHSTKNNTIRALGLQAEQIFLMCDGHSDTQLQQLAMDLSASAYVTDQSDSWVAVAVSGAQRYATLERTCTLDLHESVFEDGAVARTAMEYLSVIILRDQDRFILLSPRSSARSFWHMLTLSAEYTSEP